ncbi:SH3 domain-containing protein [Solirubrobacter taibaiensis]|nr:SH3 domain-containing protein [Solirubrobacter taibaiensis]
MRTLRLTVATCAVFAAAAPAAAAARVERICTPRATVLDSPRGLAIGVLYRGDRVTLLRRDSTRAWIRVRSAAPITGWITKRALDGC